MAKARPVNRIQDRKAWTGNKHIDRDPDMDVLLGIIAEHGWSPERIERETAKIGRPVSRHAIIGWLYGSTRRPQNWTLTSVFIAMGWRKEWLPAEQKRPSAALNVLAVGRRGHDYRELQLTERTRKANARIARASSGGGRAGTSAKGGDDSGPASVGEPGRPDTRAEPSEPIARANRRGGRVRAIDRSSHTRRRSA